MLSFLGGSKNNPFAIARKLCKVSSIDPEDATYNSAENLMAMSSEDSSTVNEPLTRSFSCIYIIPVIIPC